MATAVEVEAVVEAVVEVEVAAAAVAAAAARVELTCMRSRLKWCMRGYLS
jgi:hypothetical protein